MEMSKVLVANPSEKKCRALFAFVNFAAKLVKKVMSLFISVDNGGSDGGEHRFSSVFFVSCTRSDVKFSFLEFSLLLNNFYF